MSKVIGFILLLVIVLGFIVPQVFLSKSFASERTTEIDAPRAEVHAVVSDLTTWKEWTVWNKEADPTVTFEYTGEPGTVDHSMSWTGEDLGDGFMKIVSVAPERIGYEITFADMKPSDVEMLLEESNGKTSVKWAMAGEMEGMPFNRYLGLFMDKLIGPAYEEGLVNLKARFEGEAK